jgi:hypothetical protein
MSRGSSRGSSSTTSPRAGSSLTTSTTLRIWVPRHVVRLITRLVVDYFTYVTRPVALVRHAACRVTHRRLLRPAQARCRLLCLAQAHRRLLRLHCASRCLGTPRSSSRGSSSTTSPTPRIRVPRHVARLVTRLVAQLVVDYYASRRLVVDYFAYAAHLGASARRTARLATRRRLLHLLRTSGCLGMARGSSSTTSPTTRVRVPRHVTRPVSRLVVDYFAYVAWFVTWLVTPLAVDYFAYAACPGTSVRRVARHAARRRLLRLRRASGCLGTSRGSIHGSSSTTSLTPHVRCLGTLRNSSSTTPVTSHIRVLLTVKIC